MNSLVPRLPPSFPSLGVRTANDEKLDGAGERGYRFHAVSTLIAARTQHGLRRSKEWPLSKLKRFVTCTTLGSRFPRWLGLQVLMHAYDF